LLFNNFLRDRDGEERIHGIRGGGHCRLPLVFLFLWFWYYVKTQKCESFSWNSVTSS
jgi:hypothetical protein